MLLTSTVNEQAGIYSKRINKGCSIWHIYGKVAGDVINGKRLFAYKALLSSLGPMDRPENRGFYLIIGLGF